MSAETVRVVVRCRPMNKRETDLKCATIVDIDNKKGTCGLTCLEEPNSIPKNFTFDGAYGIDSNTETIYNDVGFPLVESVCEGYNGTVFAYGQTGCGKSFSMQGIPSHKGIVPRAFEHIFEAVSIDSTKKYLIRASYLEIYNENVRDLLGKDVKVSLDLKEHPEKGVYVSNLTWNECKDLNDCEKLMDRGNSNRSTGATLMNADSSRSHSIFSVKVEMCEKDNEGEEHYRAGKLNLVDLAGSERQGKTGATGDRLKEATKINLSLSALGNVISALVDGKSKHIPYRDSKLTRLLQDSLGGNTKTLMLAALSPAADNYEETLSTLRYANRAKNIKNKPTINEDPKDAMLRQLQEEIELLKSQLVGQGPGTVSKAAVNVITQDQIEEERNKLREEFEDKIQDINAQYEEEKMSKEALQKKMDSIKAQYDSQLILLNADNGKPPKANGKERKSGRGQRKSATMAASQAVMTSPNTESIELLDLTNANSNNDFEENDDPAQRLIKLQGMVVGGEQANNEELKAQIGTKKQYAEERKQLLADSLRKGDDEEFMLRVYDSVQEEVQYKTKLYDKEKEKCKFLEDECKDLQQEFEKERQDMLDTIRKNDKQMKLIAKILQKIQPIIPPDSNYYNMDKIQIVSHWNEEIQDWILPDFKREKLSLPSMGAEQSQNDLNDIQNYDQHDMSNSSMQMMPQQQMLLNSRRATNHDASLTFIQPREPEVDRYRIKLESSNFNGTNYFKNKRQSELLGQTTDHKTSNSRLSPLGGSDNSGSRGVSRRF